MSMRAVVALALAAFSCMSATANAQTARDRLPRRVEVTVGGLWLGGASLGSARAVLRANSPGSPTPFTLFTTESQFGSAPGVDLHVGYGLTRSLAVEAGFARLTPDLRTSISADAENAPSLTVNEQVDQYFIDVSAVLLLDRWRVGDRTIPFVSGGGGYLRQLHEGRTLIETGQVYHVGGGVKHWLSLRKRGPLRAIGVRADARLYVLVKGIDFEDRARPQGAVSGALFLTF